MKYILVYNVDDYPDNGGGYQFEDFDTSSDLDKRVEQIMTSGGREKLLVAGEINEYKYKTVEVVTKVVRED